MTMVWPFNKEKRRKAARTPEEALIEYLVHKAKTSPELFKNELSQNQWTFLPGNLLITGLYIRDMNTNPSVVIVDHAKVLRNQNGIWSGAPLGVILGEILIPNLAAQALNRCLDKEMKDDDG